MSDTATILNESSLEHAVSSLNADLALAEPPSSGKHWLFNADRARVAQRKSVEAKRKMAEREDKVIETINELKAAAIVEPDDTYRLNRLKATRDALDGLYSDLNAADDAKDQKAICDSIARLSEVERLLAGRPSPGSHRPSSLKPKRQTPESYGPVE